MTTKCKHCDIPYCEHVERLITAADKLIRVYWRDSTMGTQWQREAILDAKNAIEHLRGQ